MISQRSLSHHGGIVTSSAFRDISPLSKPRPPQSPNDACSVATSKTASTTTSTLISPVIGHSPRIPQVACTGAHSSKSWGQTKTFEAVRSWVRQPVVPLARKGLREDLDSSLREPLQRQFGDNATSSSGKLVAGSCGEHTTPAIDFTVCDTKTFPKDNNRYTLSMVTPRRFSPFLMAAEAGLPEFFPEGNELTAITRNVDDGAATWVRSHASEHCMDAVNGVNVEASVLSKTL